MRFWNFVHSLGFEFSLFGKEIDVHFHVYYFLAVILLAVMIVARLIQKRNQKKREEDAEKKLKEIEDELNPSSAPGKEKKTPKTSKKEDKGTK